MIDCPNWYRDGDGDGAWVLAAAHTCNEDLRGYGWLPSDEISHDKIRCHEDDSDASPDAAETGGACAPAAPPGPTCDPSAPHSSSETAP